MTTLTLVDGDIPTKFVSICCRPYQIELVELVEVECQISSQAVITVMVCNAVCTRILV